MKILVVEDDYKIGTSIKKGLEQESFAVDLAFDGNNGYGLASTENYDVIILDLMLPGMTGLQICQTLRQNKIHTPILILTAKGELEDKVNGLNSGADDYLVKPFAFTELLARIKALSRRPKDTFNSILNYENLSFNTINYEVKRAGKNIKLSKKEFSLLEYLLRYSDTVLSKDQIINNIWDYDANILPNTLEVYIGYLRKKIDQAFPKEKSLIQTVRGFGYKLSLPSSEVKTGEK